jgi:hypothetical protein
MVGAMCLAAEAAAPGSRRGSAKARILLGAIGGVISYGVIGLFVGAVVLAFGHQMVSAHLLVEGASPTSEVSGANG